MKDEGKNSEGISGTSTVPTGRGTWKTKKLQSWVDKSYRSVWGSGRPRSYVRYRKQDKTFKISEAKSGGGGDEYGEEWRQGKRRGIPVWRMWKDLREQGMPGHPQEENARRVAPASRFQMPPMQWTLLKREYKSEPREGSMRWPTHGILNLRQCMQHFSFLLRVRCWSNKSFLIFQFILSCKFFRLHCKHQIFNILQYFKYISDYFWLGVCILNGNERINWRKYIYSQYNP